MTIKKACMICVGIALCLASVKGLGQTNYLVLDTASTKVTKVHFDTLVTAVVISQEIRIDLDKNNKADLIFFLSDFFTAHVRDHSVRLNTADSTYFALDAAVYFGSYKDNAGIFHDTTYTATKAKMYNPRDTIFSDSCISYTELLVGSFFSRSPVYQYYHMEDWMSAIHYIGFKKILWGKEYLGWIKVRVIDFHTMYLYYYAIQSLPPNVGIDEVDSSPVHIYPNPANEELLIDGLNIGNVEIYNSLGNIVLANQNQTNTLPFKVNLGTLKNGIYVVRVSDKKSGTFFTKKIIKQ